MSSRTPTFYRPGSYKPEESVTYLMRRITVAFAGEVDDQLAPEGLTHAQWVPLLKLQQGSVRTAAEISRELHQDAGATTRMLDRLEAKGFLRRVRSQEDRRVIHLELTPEGQATAQRIPPALCEVQNAHLRGFSKDELETLKNLLRRVLANAEERQAQRLEQGQDE